MDVFLVRHGEAAASWGESPDPGLSELGRQQADVAAASLGQEITEGTQIWSSPLRRAVETAGPLARIMRQTVREDEAFREIPAPVPLVRRQIWLRQFMQQQWHEQEEGLIAWRTAALSRLLGLRRPAVVFTHFLVINAVVGQVLARDETLCFWPANGSITRLRHHGTGLELIQLGEEITTLVN
jgi:broad specificity phosphatase PhoE